jgi:hypothetical protein
VNTRVVLSEAVSSLQTSFIVAFEDGNALNRPEMFFSQYGPRGDTKLIKIDHCTSHRLRARDDSCVADSLAQINTLGSISYFTEGPFFAF